MRVLVVLVLITTCGVWLYACTQPPVEVPDDELFDCEFSKDNKFLVCHDRKRREVATKGKND
jgi:hypothetical protein